MEHRTFSPKFTPRIDSVSQSLFAFARLIIIGMIAALPLLCIPGSIGMITSTKTFFVLLILLLMVVITSLGILRSGSISLSFSPVFLAWLGVIVAGFVSAILSPTLMSSLIGIDMEVQTVGFLLLLALTMSATSIFAEAKTGLLYLFGSLILSAILLSLYQLVRIFAGENFLSFGFLQGHVATPIGGFNDLGIFLGLTLIISIITLILLPLPRRISFTLSIGLLLMLAVLMVINFFMLWFVLALLSLSLLMYSLTKDRFNLISEPELPARTSSVSLPIMALIGCIFIVSTVFLIGGSSLSNYISSVTKVNYVEVRPSVTATFEVMRHVYHDNAFTGIGPNQFANAWNQYKNASLNQTIFWNTPFNAGSGYVLTWFVTTGIFGVLAWFIFLILFVFTGFKMLLSGESSDRFWYYIGTISFVSGLYIWGMAIVYVPGPVILIIGAFSTGVMLVANRALIPGGQKTVNLLSSARTGFILILVVMVTIIGSVATGYGAVRQFSAFHTYASITTVPADENQLSTISDRLISAYTLYPSDLYAHDLAAYQLMNINRLVGLASSTSLQQQEFQKSITTAIQAAQEAVRLNPVAASNWSIMGDIYVALAAVKITGAADKAHEAYTEARKRDPQNPVYDLQEAVVAYQTGDATMAREKAMSALTLKPNFTEALFLISQLDIISGDIKKAIATTEALVSLDAYNPGRYYQLGVLEGADKNSQAAIDAFSRAIILNPNYANARYLRAQQYLLTGDKDKALADLKVVLDLNQGNTTVSTIIDKINANATDPSIFNTAASVTEPAPVVDGNQVTTTNENSDTNLVRPVNGTTEGTAVSSEITVPTTGSLPVKSGTTTTPTAE